MRFRHRDGSILHLGYGTNVLPAEDVDGVVHQLDTVAATTRRELGVDRLGVGLWLAAAVAARFRRDQHALGRLRDVLDRNGLEVVTCNAFPFGGFHDPVVKRRVYRPDWSDPARAEYTLDVAHVLAALLPEDVEVGSISTLPLGWHAWLDADGRAAARTALRRLGDELDRLRDATGRTIAVGLEPEPGCVLDTVPRVVQEVAAIGHPGIGLALDACHLAVEFEDPATVLAAAPAADVPTVKLQVSSALHVDVPGEARAELARFVEPRFLHQTRERAVDGAVRAVDDLDLALDDGLPGEGPWRVHVHVPVHHGEGTTQPVLDEVLREVVGGDVPLTRHLEVETYTWSVLPDGRRPAGPDDLPSALAAELAWVRDRLLSLGCEELTP